MYFKGFNKGRNFILGIGKHIWEILLFLSVNGQQVARFEVFASIYVILGWLFWGRYGPASVAADTFARCWWTPPERTGKYRTAVSTSADCACPSSRSSSGHDSPPNSLANPTNWDTPISGVSASSIDHTLNATLYLPISQIYTHEFLFKKSFILG